MVNRAAMIWTWIGDGQISVAFNREWKQGSHWGETADSGVAMQMPGALLLKRVGWVGGWRCQRWFALSPSWGARPLRPPWGWIQLWSRTMEMAAPWQMCLRQRLQRCTDQHVRNVDVPIQQCTLLRVSYQPSRTWQTLLRTSLSYNSFICPHFIYHQHMHISIKLLSSWLYRVTHHWEMGQTYYVITDLISPYMGIRNLFVTHVCRWFTFLRIANHSYAKTQQQCFTKTTNEYFGYVASTVQ